MKVIDASVLVPSLLDEAEFVARRRSLLLDDQFAAPELIDVEVASALRRLVRQGAIEPYEGEAALADLAELPFARASHEPLLPRIWELRDNLSAYDASYVALAELLGASFVTADASLASAPGVRCEIELVS